ncbi:hypothetical protein KL918_001651 [Ogataea parapolymorpha]|uniref:Small ribosomal subunit protein bS18m n=1 Tax=Ogataea parapolymorpha (strain ATCC 26012 / BCRC 20466 / JCM 22074 / NRRL Y-7560 / DL-1) TaxID=871575 RepID=W1QD71_OGAPD|nr:hypothetical protein HPODL_03308 [Ogataea parapolymorpha DL-1]ESW99418.1 hypothetical protein HPODL_03308 [Ogataea parapolymorpha DL-1]KAG7869008.1 hypothetical protein KL918_001651 [Ogataea parapolymorpha]KAG7874089.1 hypothetical protein KL916_001863 [Ogataea parapolymorpha]
MLMFRRTFVSSAKQCEEYTLKNAMKSIKDQQTDLESRRQAVINPALINGFENQKTYDPFDFSVAKLRYAAKQERDSRRKRLAQSTFNTKEVSPLDFYCFPKVLSQYMSVTGNIHHRSVTQLQHKKQQQMTRAIKRAIQAGFLSPMSRDVAYSPKRGDTL